MTSAEYQQLVEFLGHRFLELRQDRPGHFEAISHHFEQLEQEYRAITQARRRIDEVEQRLGR